MKTSKTAALILTLFSSLAATPASAQNTWTTLTARLVSSDVAFPQFFEADRAIAIRDTNGNCRIDTYPIGDPNEQFPFVLSPSAATFGQHIGSPYSLVPDVDANGNVFVTAAPGICGRTMIYGEMVRNGTTYFIWFALADGGPVAAGYNPAWGYDFGFGSYSDLTNGRTPMFTHTTLVKDFRANNGTPKAVESPQIHYWGGTPGTLQSPGHIFSVDAVPDRPFPAPWGRFTAATLSSAYNLNFFTTVEGVTIDVPLVDEASWDGATLFPAQIGVGRLIQAIGNGADNRVASVSVSAPTTHPIQGDFNGDRKQDIALWKPGLTSVPVYSFNGTGFTITNIHAPPGLHVISDPTVSRLVGDFTGDGKTDILFWKPGWMFVTMYISLGNGAFRSFSSWDASGFDLINATPASGKMVGDFNGDGKADIALFRSEWNSTPVYFSNGNGTFRFTNYLTPAGMNVINDPTTRRWVADFNGDGKADVLLSRQGWNSAPLYLSSGSGWFTATNFYLGTTNWLNDMNAHPMLGDFDNDRKADLAFWKPGWNSTPIYFSNGNGTFRITNYITSASEVNDPVSRKLVGDFNGDGKTDIAVTKPGYANVPIYTSSGAGWFTRTALTPPNGGNAYLNSSAEALVGDFDGDRKADILVRAPGWVSVPVYISQGSGAFRVNYSILPANQNWLNQ